MEGVFFMKMQFGNLEFKNCGPYTREPFIFKHSYQKG